jgi:hypothetical protein
MRHQEIITEMAVPPNVKTLLDELMPFLQPNLSYPEIKIVNHTNPKALAVCQWTYAIIGRDDFKMPDKEKYLISGKLYCGRNTTISIEKSVIGDENTLRRVLAHELCHHEDSLINDTEDFFKLGFNAYAMRLKYEDFHGAEWREIASRFNAKYGNGFVSKYSDQSYVQSSNEKPFFVVLEPWLTRERKIYQRLYAYTVRPSEKQKTYLQRQYEPWKMFKITDQAFLGAKLGVQGWSSVGEMGEKFDKWNDLWENGEVVASANLEKLVNTEGEL